LALSVGNENNQQHEGKQQDLPVLMLPLPQEHKDTDGHHQHHRRPCSVNCRSEISSMKEVESNNNVSSIVTLATSEQSTKNKVSIAALTIVLLLYFT
jgi:hypothetical protein